MPYISHESLIESKKVDYYIALGKTQQTWKSDYEDIYPWIDFFLSDKRTMKTIHQSIKLRKYLNVFIRKTK